MKHVLKNAGYMLIGCSLSFYLSACSGNGGKNSSTDSTSASTTTAADTSSMAANANNAKGSSSADANMQFVNDVTKANTNEIMMLQAGIDKGTNRELKSDAKKMLTDHKKLAKDMQDYASKKNMTLPTVDTSMNSMSDLNGKTGKDWDKAWTDDMVDGHKKTIDRFEKGQNEVTDADLKTLITNTLPTLHNHLDMVTKLQTTLNK